MLQENSGRSRQQTRFQKISNKTWRIFRNEIPLFEANSLTTICHLIGVPWIHPNQLWRRCFCAPKTDIGQTDPMKLPKVGQLEHENPNLDQVWMDGSFDLKRNGSTYTPLKNGIHKKNHEDIISTTELWTKRWNCCKRIWTNKLLKFITDLISLHLEDKRPGASHRKLLRSTKWLSRTVTFSPVAKIELLEQVLHLLQN